MQNVSKNKKSGKCHELPRKSNFFLKPCGRCESMDVEAVQNVSKNKNWIFWAVHDISRTFYFLTHFALLLHP